IADWLTAMLGIFWSVWWGFFMNTVLNQAKAPYQFHVPFLIPATTIPIERSLYLTVNATVISFFAVVYVRWLWDIQRFAYHRVKLREAVDTSIWLVLAIFFLLSSVGFGGNAFNISPDLIQYGATLTLLWPFLILFAIWKK